MKKIAITIFPFILFIACAINQPSIINSNKDIVLNRDSLIKDANNSLHSLNLTIYQYPQTNYFNYRLDTLGVSVYLKNKQNHLDSLLFNTKTLKFDSTSVAQFKLKENPFFKLVKNMYYGKYVNKCFEDGEMYSISIFTNDSVVRKINFCNMHNDTLEYVIKFFNHNVDSTLRIYYDKAKLIKYMDDCK